MRLASCLLTSQEEQRELGHLISYGSISNPGISAASSKGRVGIKQEYLQLESAKSAKTHAVVHRTPPWVCVCVRNALIGRAVFKEGECTGFPRTKVAVGFWNALLELGR